MAPCCELCQDETWLKALSRYRKCLYWQEVTSHVWVTQTTGVKTHTLICGQSVAASQETHTDRQSAWWEWRRCCSSLCSPLWVTIFITSCFLHQLTLILQLQHVKCQFVSLTLCWLQIPAALFTTDLFSDPLPSFYTLKLFWLNFEFRKKTEDKTVQTSNLVLSAWRRRDAAADSDSFSFFWLFCCIFRIRTWILRTDQTNSVELQTESHVETVFRQREQLVFSVSDTRLFVFIRNQLTRRETNCGSSSISVCGRRWKDKESEPEASLIQNGSNFLFLIISENSETCCPLFSLLRSKTVRHLKSKCHCDAFRNRNFRICLTVWWGNKKYRT